MDNEQPFSIDDFLARLLAEQARLKELDWTPPEPPPAPPVARGAQLTPLLSSCISPKPPVKPLDTVRAELPTILDEYIHQGTGQRMQIIRTAAGSGKTHATAKFMQEEARRGKRILWAAQRHKAFTDIEKFDFYDADLWLHWRGRSQLNDDGVPMCQHWRAQEKWTALGYSGSALCAMLNQAGQCDPEKCPYIQQQKSTAPIVYCMHQNTTVGLNLPKFDYAVIDELPVSAYIKNRAIPPDGLLLNVSGPLKTLLEKLYGQVGWLKKGESLAAKKLFDIIGPDLIDVYAQYELGIGALPKTPRIGSPSEVYEKAYWFVEEFLLAAAQEFECWRNGWEDWARRVWLDKQGLHILSRAEVWDKLPYKLVMLDATAEERFTFMTLARESESYAPNIQRAGRLYQIANRLYSRKQLYQKVPSVEVGKDGKVVKTFKIKTRPSYTEALAIIRELCAKHSIKNPGVISYQDLETLLKVEFGEDNVMHFGALRGSNDLEHVDGLFILGTPSPRFTSVIETATALNPQHRAPFYVVTEDGKRRPQYVNAEREYRLSPPALAGVIERQGFPSDTVGVSRITGVCEVDELAVVLSQLREMELVQALNRSRFLARNIPVFLLTSTPLDEELDGLYLDPPLTTHGLHWKTFLRLKPVLDAMPELAQLWSDDLAFITGISEQYIKNNRLLVAITENFSWWHTYLAKRPGRARAEITIAKYDPDVSLLDTTARPERLSRKMLEAFELYYRTGKLNII